MKPDSYMPFYGPVFWADMEGRKDDLIVAYLRAITHYWHFTRCEGLENDADSLMGICRLSPEAYERIGPVIFGKLFKMDDGKWHQKRARAEWVKSQEKLAFMSKVGKKAAAARWNSTS